MLKNCLETFEKKYMEKGEGFILDSYVLPFGSYILIDKSGSIQEVFEIDKNNSDRTDSRYSYFAERDYLSKLLDMNKPIDGKKVIHSNNYLSFFIKKENVNPKKLTEEVIDNYYNILLEPRTKYNDKDKNKKALYENIENKVGKVDEERLVNIKTWIKENIFNINEMYKDDKNYLKIFFEEDIEIFKRESDKYVIPNIYNNTQYNENINGIIFGLPNDNMGLNGKKPFLEHKTRKNTIPYLIDEKEVMLQKKFFDYLMNKVSEGKSNIYIDEDEIYALENGGDIRKEKLDFKGIYLKVKKGKEVEIHDVDIITSMKENINKFKYKKIVPIDYMKVRKDPRDFRVNDVKDLEMYINEVFFNKFLCNNYFTEAKDIKLNDGILKEELINNRNAFFSWFYKGNKSIAKNSFRKMSLKIIKNSICLDTYVKPREQFNLRWAVLDYFGGDKDMGDTLNSLILKVREKINNNTTLNIESDDEYYFSVGQLVSYYISLKKSSKRMHSLLNPILNCRSDEKLKGELRKLFKKYNYAIKKESKRFNNLQAMVSAYESKGKINEDLLIAGYLCSSLIYEKGEE